MSSSESTVKAETAVTAMTAALASARWISPFEPVVAPAGQRPAYELTGGFEWLAANPEPAPVVVYATAHGIYELFINGVRVGDEELSPGFTSYRTRLQVQRYDISALLLPGENNVSALLSDGWYRGRHGFVRRADGFGTTTSFLAAVVVEPQADLSTPLLVTDDTWVSRASHLTRADLMDGQSVDFRLRASEAVGAADPAGAVDAVGAVGAVAVEIGRAHV